MSTCASCEAELRPEWKFCVRCGTAVIPGAIRPQQPAWCCTRSPRARASRYGPALFSVACFIAGGRRHRLVRPQCLVLSDRAHRGAALAANRPRSHPAQAGVGTTDRYLWGLILIVSGTPQCRAAISTPSHSSARHRRPRHRLVDPARPRVATGSRGIPRPAVRDALLTGPQSVWSSRPLTCCGCACATGRCAATSPWCSPLPNGVIVAQFFEEYDGMPLALAIAMVVFVASAWLARLIAQQGRRRYARHPVLPAKTGRLVAQGIPRKRGTMA